MPAPISIAADALSKFWKSWHYSPTKLRDTPTSRRHLPAAISIKTRIDRHRIRRDGWLPPVNPMRPPRAYEDRLRVRHHPRPDLRFLDVLDDYMLAGMGPPQNDLLAENRPQPRPARQCNIQIIPP